MSFDLGHGKTLDDAPGLIALSTAEYPPLPDAAIANHAAGFLKPASWFSNSDAPLELEIGCGKGTFIMEQSARAPGVNYLGIEWAREFYLYTADRLRRAQRTNARMLHTNATEFLRWRTPRGAFRVIHLYFSDPWPKTKHHKNRVVQDRFLAEAWRTLVPHGELRVVTDHDDLWAWDTQHFSRWTTPNHPRESRNTESLPLPDPPFDLLPFTPPDWVGEGQTIGTNYERKMCVERGAGKQPHACVLRKRGA
jgi:tRNA (guanine-N7-)-methyltransferase